MLLELIGLLDDDIQWFIGVTDHHPGLMALLAGAFIFVVYRAQRIDDKSNAAKLILQEIRYAEQKVKNFRSHSSYNLSEKILPTNNWNGNISLFVDELGETEIDQISDFYSKAARLDEILQSVGQYRNTQLIQPETPSASTEVHMDTGHLAQQAKDLIQAVSQEIGELYNTPATNRLRFIANRKWYRKFFNV